MRHALYIFLVLSVTLKANAQGDHLEPARNLSGSQGISKEYHDKVFSLLSAGMKVKPYARYTVLPSFEKEYAFSVEQVADGCYIISNSLSENYWYAGNKAEVKVISRRIKIDERLFQIIGDLFSLVTAQIRKPEQETVGLDGLKRITMRADGVIYYFASTDNNGKELIGEKWSPGKHSLMGRLVKVCDTLYSLSIGKDLSFTALESELVRLIEDIKK
ncbi:MAG: hypothetical protein M0Q53_19735 [Prolixibacteraceae bacterium]|jgi:hypothetical protein|nr:hypothetical protein [Prolixibacteraceae bacterium]